VGSRVQRHLLSGCAWRVGATEPFWPDPLSVTPARHFARTVRAHRERSRDGRTRPCAGAAHGPFRRSAPACQSLGDLGSRQTPRPTCHSCPAGLHVWHGAPSRMQPSCFHGMSGCTAHSQPGSGDPRHRGQSSRGPAGSDFTVRAPSPAAFCTARRQSHIRADRPGT
jgi:hypothetical protein